MNGNAAMNYRNPNMIRKMGVKALAKELGPVGMAQFIRQYDDGEGDYTEEREEMLRGITMGDIRLELDKFTE